MNKISQIQQIIKLQLLDLHYRSNAGHIGSFNQPPAKHKASPIIGSQEKNKTQIPLLFIIFRAFCFFSGKRAGTENFFAVNIPNPHVVIAPNVFPIAAIITNS